MVASALVAALRGPACRGGAGGHGAWRCLREAALPRRTGRHPQRGGHARARARRHHHRPALRRGPHEHPLQGPAAAPDRRAGEHRGRPLFPARGRGPLQLPAGAGAHHPGWRPSGRRRQHHQPADRQEPLRSVHAWTADHAGEQDQGGRGGLPAGTGVRQGAGAVALLQLRALRGERVRGGGRLPPLLRQARIAATGGGGRRARGHAEGQHGLQSQTAPRGITRPPQHRAGTDARTRSPERVRARQPAGPSPGPALPGRGRAGPVRLLRGPRLRAGP